MSIAEAQDLAFDIKCETTARVQLHQLGNGEWVILLNTNFHIWSVQDYEQWKRAMGGAL